MKVHAAIARLTLCLHIGVQPRYVLSPRKTDMLSRYPRVPGPGRFFPRRSGALPREADYLLKVGRGSHRPRWQSLASVIDDSVFPGVSPPLSRFRALSRAERRYVKIRESRPERMAIVSIVTD